MDNFFLIGKFDTHIAIYDADTYTYKCTMKAKIENREGVLIYPDKIITSSKKRLQIWDYEGRYLYTVDNEISNLCVVGKNIFASISKTGDINIWDINTLDCIKRLTCPYTLGKIFTVKDELIVYSQMGMYFCEKNTINKFIQDIAILPDDRIAILGDNILEIYHVNTHIVDVMYKFSCTAHLLTVKNKIIVALVDGSMFILS